MGKKLPQPFAAGTVIKLAVISLVTVSKRLPVSNIYHSTYFYGGSAFLNLTKPNTTTAWIKLRNFADLHAFKYCFSHSVFYALLLSLSSFVGGGGMAL